MTINVHDVFVNCPFDAAYKPIFNAIIYTVVRSGYRVRCALETDDAGDNRYGKICGIIAQCKLRIHDISRTEADGDPPLPRFNMPFELGLFLGAQRFGNKQQKGKACIVFDRERFRYQRFFSDISGQDVHAHDGDVSTVVRELASWLRKQPGGIHADGGQAILDEYSEFESLLPIICEKKRMEVAELEFPDFNSIVTEYVTAV